MAADKSSLQVFRAAVKLRNLPVFQKGSMEVHSITGSDKHPGIFAFVRHLPRTGTDTGMDTDTELQRHIYIVAMNVGLEEEHRCDLTKHVKKEVLGAAAAAAAGSVCGTIVLASSESIYLKEQSVDLRHVRLRAGDAVVIQVIL